MNVRYFKLFSVLVLVAVIASSCKKDNEPAPTPTPTTTDPEIKAPVDPEVAKTVGLFLENWAPKKFSAPQFTEEAAPATAAGTITIDASSVVAKIPSTIFGHNANIWMSRMIDQAGFMKNLTDLKPNVIRFPAGSGSDVYFWNAEPGKLPADVPEKLLDASGVEKDPGFCFGKTTEDWRASLDNYYAVLKATNSIGVLTVNYGYARYGTSDNPVTTAAHLAADWVRYDKGRTKYWEIGNEVYADWEWSYHIDQTKNKDGQPEFITGKLYAEHFKIYADSMRKAATEVGSTIYIGAVMYESAPQSWQAASFQNWNKLMLPALSNRPDFYIGHNYFTPYGENSTASVVLNSALSEPSKMISFMTSTMTSNGATVKPVAMTEYNMWASKSKQQVSNVSGEFAALILCEAIKNNYGLAARWDLLNGWNGGDDHGMFSDGNEPGVDKWTARPSFYYLYMLQRCTGDRMVKTTVDKVGSTIKAYGTTFESGGAGVAIANIGASNQVVELKFSNLKKGTRYYWYTLEGSNDNGEFSRKVLINGTGPTGVAGGPSTYEAIKAKSSTVANGIRVTVPLRGMVYVMVEGG